MKKGYVPIRWRNYIPGKRIAKEAAREAGSTAVLTLGLAGAIGYLGGNFVESARESVRMGRHATHTVKEMVVGTPGQRAASKLGDLYQALNEQGLTIDQFTGQVRTSIAQREQLIDSIGRTYEVNETIAREAGRLVTQLEGMVPAATAAGDGAINKFLKKLTGHSFEDPDDFFMNSVSNANTARENLPVLQEIYRDARKFYDGREKSEVTIKQLCEHLASRKEAALSENARINSALDQVVGTLDKAYRAEDKVLSTTGKISLIRNFFGTRGELEEGEISQLESAVSDYQTNVDATRTTAEGAVPIGPYQRGDAWIDYGINPVTLALVGVLAVKGISSFTPPTRRALTTATLAPVYLAGKAAKGIYSLAKNAFTKSETLKNERGVK